MQLIIQYLRDEGHLSSMLTVQDEANIKISEGLQRRNRVKKIQAAITAGECSRVSLF